MTKSLILAAMLVLPLSAGPCHAEGTQRDGELISENTVRLISAGLYSDLLAQACRNGWRYPRSRIEKGFRRHLEELKLQLVAQGYTIVPDVTANSSFFETAFVARRQPVASRQFGCSRPYWRDD